MGLVLKNRCKETSTTTGTGAYTLAGAVTGFQAFSAIGDGNTCYYVATDGVNWEAGVGTYTLAGTTLARTAVLASSNAGAAVNWGAGTKTIFVDLPAEKTLESLLTARGDIVVRDSNAVPARLALGGALTVLGSDGTDAAWQSPFGKLLTSGNVSAAATLDIPFSAYTAYRGILIKLARFLPVTDGSDLWMRFSIDAGATYSTSGYDWGVSQNVNAATSTQGVTGDTKIVLNGGGSVGAGGSPPSGSIGNVSNEGYSGSIEIPGQATTSFIRAMFSGVALNDSTTTHGVSSAGGGAKATSAHTCDAVRLLFSAGNIASGNYAVYGLT